MAKRGAIVITFNADEGYHDLFKRFATEMTRQMWINSEFNIIDWECTIVKDEDEIYELIAKYADNFSENDDEGEI